MALSYYFPYRLIVKIANFLFLGCFVTKKKILFYLPFFFHVLLPPGVTGSQQAVRINSVTDDSYS